MPKITGCKVSLGGVWQPEQYESVRASVGLEADLTEDTDPVQAVRLVQQNVRSLLESGVRDVLRSTGRLTAEQEPFNLDAAPVIDLESQAGITPESVSVAYGQTWQLRQFESFRGDLELFADLEEGDNPESVVRQLLSTAKALVREDARPVLEANGRIRPRRTERLSGLEIVNGGRNDEQPAAPMIGGVQLLP